MRTDPDFLTLFQWLSPGFPIGSFAYSHGLEAAVAAGWVQDAGDLQGWLDDVLCFGTGRADAIWLRLAADDPAQALDFHAEACSFAPSAERLREASRQGAAFAQTVRAVWRMDVPDTILPVAVGVASGLRRMDVDAVTALYLQAFVSNLVACAQRLLPIGQVAGQDVIAALQERCIAAAERARSHGADDIFSAAYLSDIAAMRHETQRARVFQT